MVNNYFDISHSCPTNYFDISHGYPIKVNVKVNISVHDNNNIYRKSFFHPFHHENIF